MVQTNKLDTKGLPIELILTAMTFLDPVIGWSKIGKVTDNNMSNIRDVSVY